MNIYDLISRAQKLRKETQLDSVSPDRVGGLHEDTLKYINEFQLLASSPSLHKIYASVSAMQSDKSPKSDLTGKPLKPGQLVVIVPANQTDATAGDVYRYDGPSGNTSAWTFVAKIGAVPADVELSATSTNPPQNKVVTEKLTELESETKDLYGDYTSNNSEYIRLLQDSDNCFLEGTKADGTKHFGGDVSIDGSADIRGNMNFKGASFENLENPEWLDVKADSKGRILEGTKADGSKYAYNIQSESIETKVDKVSGKSLIDKEVADCHSIAENEEYHSIETDADGKMVSSRTKEGVKREYVGIETPSINIDGIPSASIHDRENRMEILMDANEKVVSYRDEDGNLHEKVGVKTKKISADYIDLSQSAINDLGTMLDSRIAKKNSYLPSFGKVDIKEEVFYLDKGNWTSYKDDVVLIQVYDDTANNASSKLTLAAFYVKSTLTQLSDGGYDKTSITPNSVALELHAGKDVVSIDGKYFATAIYTPTKSGESIVDFIKNKAEKVIDSVTGNVVGYEYQGRSTEVVRVKDVPPIKAWKISKDIEHYCVANIDFGDFYKKNDVSVSIKYQGSGSLRQRKRGLRITFYKDQTYAKKDKIKIGELVRLSGFNMKSYGRAYSMINDPMLSNLFIEIWESRGKDCYPWNKDSVPFNGATGMIKSFPIETYMGGSFWGLQYFGYKKDERNYMLDGDDDASGIFVSGEMAKSGWESASPKDFVDELGADGRDLAYSELGDDSVSKGTAAAMSELFKCTKGLSDGVIEIDGESVEFKTSMLEEHIDLESWIDYFIGLQVFQLWDNTYHNLILHTRADKKKFFVFFYDLDVCLEYSYDRDIVDICREEWNYSTIFWEKFADSYKDSIINRYAELRKTILTSANMKSIYHSYADSIPQSAIERDVTLWNSGKPSNFENTIRLLEERLMWLDSHLFNLK